LGCVAQFIPELFSGSKFFMIFKAKILNSIYVCVLKSAQKIFKIIMIFGGSFISSRSLSWRLGIIVKYLPIFGGISKDSIEEWGE